MSTTTTTDFQARAISGAVAAARAGTSLTDWVESEFMAIEDEAFAAGAPLTLDTDAITRAYESALRESWQVRWTTAPVEYDGMGTVDAEACGTWRGRALRRVVIDPRHLDWQEHRYLSGLEACWAEDPCAADARAEGVLTALADSRRANAERTERGRAWLATASPDEIDTACEADTLGSTYGLTYADVRAERTRRADAALRADHEAARASALEVVTIGCTLVDDGAPARRTAYGAIPARPSRVYYAIGWTPISPTTDPEVAVLQSSDRTSVGSLAHVARQIRAGVLRVVDPATLPPEPVLRRVGHDRLAELHAAGSLWVHRAPWGGTDTVYDARGRKVRGLAARSAAADVARRLQ